MSEERTPYLVQVPGRESWHIRDGRRRFSTGETDRGRATSALIEYIGKRGGDARAAGGKAGATLGDILDIYDVERRRQNEKTWSKKWRFIVARLRSSEGWKPLEEIGRPWSERYAASRLQDVAEPTVRQEIATVSAAWKIAMDRGLTRLPVPVFALPAASEPRDVFLSRDEARRLIESATAPHLRLFIRLGLATGGRHEALLDLKWSSVDLQRGFIDLRNRPAVAPGSGRAARGPREKGRAHVRIEGEALMQELKEARRRSVTGHVIEFRGARLKSIAKGFREAVVRAGLNPRDVTPHVLRHTAATWSVADGVDLWEVAGMLGHKDVNMIKRVYGHHSPDFMRGASRALRQDF
ncbi:tyrosine-type recombinase/integrase [Pseudoroseicyclus aestuarii]|nr:site-specific integrase [Pseudoroseicyclus aestuarii]